LPYIEKKEVWAAPTSAAVVQASIPIYFCPSLRGPTFIPYVESNPTSLRATMVYVGNGGTNGTWASYKNPPNTLDGPLVPSPYSANTSGVTVRYKNITDGTSNSLLVGEKYLPIANPATRRCNNDQGYVDGWDNDAICCARSDSSGAAAPGTPVSPPIAINATGPACGLLFGSIHASCQVVFCDGSVHSIGFDIDPNVWLALCTINGGETISDYSAIN
jgi:hypothetical protein